MPQVVDHRPCRVLGGRVEVAADAGGAVEGAEVDVRGQRAGRGAVLRRGDRAALLQREAHRRRTSGPPGRSRRSRRRPGSRARRRCEKSAPSTPTGRYSVVPLTSWRVSRLPPKRLGGITGTRARARRADAHRAHERRQRDRRCPRGSRAVAQREVEDAQVGLGEVVGQQPEARAGSRSSPSPSCAGRGPRSRACRRARRPRRRPGRRAGTRGPSRGPRSRSMSEPGPIWSSLTSRVSKTTVSPSAIVSSGSFPASHVKCTESVGQ